MSEQISVRELKEYWDHLEDLKEGESADRYIHTFEMPPWDEICSSLG